MTERPRMSFNVAVTSPIPLTTPSCFSSSGSPKRCLARCARSNGPRCARPSATWARRFKVQAFLKSQLDIRRRRNEPVNGSLHRLRHPSAVCTRRSTAFATGAASVPSHDAHGVDPVSCFSQGGGARCALQPDLAFRPASPRRSFCAGTHLSVETHRR